MRKKERLSRAEFNRFFSVGKRQNSPYFQLVYTPHNELHASVVVSKKVEKTAVKRNKLRRRVYDIVRIYTHGRSVVGVFILIAKPGARVLTFPAIKADILDLIGRATRTPFKTFRDSKTFKI